MNTVMAFPTQKVYAVETDGTNQVKEKKPADNTSNSASVNEKSGQEGNDTITDQPKNSTETQTDVSQADKQESQDPKAEETTPQISDSTEEKSTENNNSQPGTKESENRPPDIQESESDKEPDTSKEPASESTRESETIEMPTVETTEKKDKLVEPEENNNQLKMTEEIDFNKLPELLITEIMANSNGVDRYNYFEVHNNSNQPVMLDHYHFSLSPTDGSDNDKRIDFPPETLEPNETIVFWLKNSSKTLSDFNSHYQTNVTANNIIEYSGVPNLDGSGNLAVVIQKRNGEEIVSANLAGDMDSGIGVEYQYPKSGTVMETYQNVANPTPGQTTKEQLPEKPVTLPENSAPIIHHKPLEEAESEQDLTIEAEITDEAGRVAAKLYYQTGPEENYQMVEMSLSESGTYQAVVPREELAASTLHYYITVTDPNNRVSYPANPDTPIEVSFKLAEEENSENFDSYPHLLVTELSPNSQGGGTDYYEYFEIYNNTNQPLPLNNYTFEYRYTDSGTGRTFQIPATTIESQETLIFWHNNGKKELSDFNHNFDLSLTSEQVIEITDPSFPGFSNGGDRAIVLSDNNGNELISADYLGEDNDNTGAVIQYKYPAEGTEMAMYRSLASPTPGIIEAIQVPAQPAKISEIPEDTQPPKVTHTPIKEIAAFSSVNIEAIVKDDIAVPSATLYFKTEESESFTSLAMSANSEQPSTYAAEIPGAEVQSDITYYIEATDGTNTYKTEEYLVEINQEKVDYDSLPAFMVTEIVPDTSNVGSADGFEFIEIYNNTDQPINFKDYKMQYRYGSDPESDVVWPSIPNDVVIPPNETLVFWIINGQNGDQTVADFNANFGTSLVENEDIVKIHSAGMANGSMRGLIVATNSGQELAVASYNDLEGTDDTKPNKGIVYKYPADGSNVMEKVSAGIQDATPGSLEAFQMPEQPVQAPEDTVIPTIDNLTEVSEVDQTENINIKAEAKDNIGVKTVRLYYRTSGQEAYQTALLQQDYDDLMYHYKIYTPEIIAKEYVEYYFVVSDGSNEVTSETYKVKVTNDIDDSSLRLNVSDGDIISGKKTIKGTSKDDSPEDVRLFIDDKEVLENTFNNVEHTAYFAFEVSGINTYFQNGVTIGEETIEIFDDWMAQWETITVPIDPDQLQAGENTITIRAGNKASPFNLESEENRDDYNLRNVRLVLSDGTILTDPSYANSSEVLDMGDNGTYRPFEDFTFTIADGLAPSKSYNWNTETASDGEHTVTAKDTDEEIQTKVFVDNTAPSITTSVEGGKEYRGKFDIDVAIKDEIAGVESSKVMLDDEEISVPYTTSSGKLSAGNHQLVVTAIDKVGNKREKVVDFSVINENPAKPKNVSPAVDEGDPVLSVNVSDPTEDELDVSFYQGYQYDPGDVGHVKAFSNAWDVEPPDTPYPEGEKAFTKGDISLTSELDGKYLATDSNTQFPYHRFDVTVDSSVGKGDIVELVWKGNSFVGRKVTMYAWNHTTEEWKIIDYRIAGKEDFELKGNVSVADFVNEDKVNVLVQDEIPSTPASYDYSFVWMSDTQYYSESYPYIFERQTQWIAEKQEEMKLKYVFHTGDLVDEYDKEYQWNHADEYMGTLDDAGIPYGVLAGNHDVGQKTNDYSEYYKYFGADRFKDKSYYGGSYKNNRGHYDLISVDGNDYIMVYLGWGVKEEGIAWMNDVLAAYPNRKAILNFHEYLLASGTRHPLGEELYNKIVVPNENVIAVLSGHYHESQLLIDEIDDNGDGKPDRTVYQMLADYQAGPEGGQGYLRLFHLDTTNNKMMVNTYSPYLDDYNYYNTDAYPGKDEFTLDLDLEPEVKRVATDYFAVNVYTDTAIGKEENVPSGETAEVTWEGLEDGRTYSWYTVVSDDYSGEATSDIWTFVKGKDEPPVETPSDPSNEGTDDGKEETEKPSEPEGPVNPGEDEKDAPEDKPKTDDGASDGRGENQENDNLGDKDREKDEDHMDTNGENLNKIGGGNDALPDTATMMYNLIAIGLALVLTGSTMYIYYRRKSVRV